MSICSKCGSIVEIVAHIGEWDEEIDLYNYLCPVCGSTGITGLEICQCCKYGALELNYYNDLTEAYVFTCNHCSKEYER